MLRFLSDSELARLKASHPHIAEGRCPTCWGEGVYVWKGITNECNCREQKQLNKLYTDAGIGLPFQRLDWDDLVWSQKQLAPINEYMDKLDRFINRGIGLFISGPNGTGKSLIANLILKRLVKEGHLCYFTTLSGMVEEFSAGWYNDDEKKWFKKRYMISKVLCLDDLGKEFKSSTKLSASTFDYTLRTRVHSGCPTILTTNLSPQEVRTGYGAAALSLLMEQSIGVHIEGVDFRPRAYDRSRSEDHKDEIRPIV